MKKIIAFLIITFLIANVASSQILHNVGGTTVKAEMKSINDTNVMAWDRGENTSPLVFQRQLD